MPVVFATPFAEVTPATRRIIDGIDSLPSQQKYLGEELGRFIERFLLSAPNRPVGYLPGGMIMLRKLLQPEYVREWLDWRLAPRRDISHEQLTWKIVYGDAYSQSPLPVTHMVAFMVLVWIDALDKLPAFIAGGLNDMNVPVMTSGQTRDPRTDLTLPRCMLELSATQFDQFMKLQWRFLAPMFTSAPSTRMLDYPDVMDAPMPCELAAPVLGWNNYEATRNYTVHVGPRLYSFLAWMQNVKLHAFNHDWEPFLGEFCSGAYWRGTSVLCFSPIGHRDNIFVERGHLNDLIKSLVKGQVHPPPNVWRIMATYKQHDQHFALFIWGDRLASSVKPTATSTRPDWMPKPSVSGGTPWTMVFGGDGAAEFPPTSGIYYDESNPTSKASKWHSG